MQAGDSFFLSGVAGRHLWVFVSDPGVNPERVVFLSLTSLDVTKEDVCIIRAGEHPFVKHRTCVAYHDPREASRAKLRMLEAAGRLLIQQPILPPILDRIRRGISLSREIPMKYVEFLLDQGAIE